MYKIMSSSEKLSEDQKAGGKHREHWIDLSGEIREGFPEEVALEHGLQGARERVLCVDLRGGGF